VSFAQFPQQLRAIQLLQRSLQRGRLSHAYLFSGADLGQLEGIARTLAKALNCTSSHDAAASPQNTAPEGDWDSCDQCDPCQRIDAETHPDIHWVRPESKSRVITIDQMRGLMEAINLKPTQARWKAAIIVAADRLNVQAANAFLKTLEEPPPRSILLLLSTNPEGILETILSRCLRLNFAGDSRPRLDPDALDWLRAFSDMAARAEKGLLGRYRLLGSLLSQLAEIKSQTDKDLTARSPLERYGDIEPRLREKWEDELAAAIEAEYRRRRGEVLLALQWWLRDVWLHGLAVGQELISFPMFATAAQAVARRVAPADALANLDVIEQTQRLLGSNVQEALAIEIGLLKLKLG
jgi:DNA polymerase-3 subunit delta'